MLGCSRSGNRSTPPATLSRFPLPCCTTNMCFRAFFVSYTCQRRSGVDHMVLIYHSLLITNTSILPAFFFPCSPWGINQRFFFGGHLSPGPTRCVVLVNSGMFACPGSMIMCVLVDHTYTFFVEEMPSPVPTNKGLMLCFGFWFLLVVDISG